MVPVPVPRYQMPTLGGCSCFLYHMAYSELSAGVLNWMPYLGREG